MTNQAIDNLEGILAALIAEHRKLMGYVQAHQAAMRTFNLSAMNDAASLQESCRVRISSLENRRRNTVTALGRLHRMNGLPTVAQIAELYPTRRTSLLALREELRHVLTELGTRTHVAARVAGAVLGHLNTVVRLVAGAVQQPGVYTKSGAPQVNGRIGIMEAVG